MSTNLHIERFLERVEPGRRDALRKILAGAAVYATPVVASFSMSSLDAQAQAQATNQSIPASSGWSLAALTGMIAAAAAVLLRRRRNR
jgi:MYXO-CTERM domain-containing protein